MPPNSIREDTEFFQTWAAFAMLLGPGAAMGFYISMVGFFVANFESRVFFLAMVFCVTAPGLLVAFLQHRFDADFDAAYSAVATYIFRTVVSQLLLAVVFLVWACVAQTPYLVLVVGLMTGFLTHSIYSSSMQMIATMNPLLTPYAAWGNLCGSALPVLVFFLASFSPASHLVVFQQVILTVPILCVLSSAFLGFLHRSKKSVFEATFDQLTRESSQSLSSRFSTTGLHSQPDAETTPLLRESSQDEVPVWVWVWCGYNGLSASLSVSMVALVAFLRPPHCAQKLVQSKLVVDIMGAGVAMVLQKLHCFAAGPWHAVLALSAVIRISLFCVLVLHLGGAHVLLKSQLYIVWVLLHGIHATISPLSGTSISLFVHPSKRRKMQAANVGCFFAGCLFGVIMTMVVIVPAFHLGTNWPASDRTVPTEGAGTPQEVGAKYS